MNYPTGNTLFAVLILVSVSACGTGEASLSDMPELPASTPMTVVVASPRIGDIYATYETTATIAADSDAPVIARADGQIMEITAEEGDVVQAGQVLARLDGERSRLRMLQAKANLEKSTREYERQINLRERGLVSAASLEGLKFDVESLKATYDLSRLDFEYTVIRAPISGVIASREVKEGSHVNANDPLFQIANTATLVAYLKIPQSELSRFTAGSHADVRVDSMPGISFRATIARISPTIDARTGTFKVTADLDNQSRDLAPGMFARFSIAFDKHSDALLVPKSAIVYEESENVVYVVEDGSAVRRPVVLGFESVDMIEILSGLGDHEKVIIAGQAGLRDGSKVLADTRAHGATTG
jgi:membrane fusion protein (multidrug efflux system)